MAHHGIGELIAGGIQLLLASPTECDCRCGKHHKDRARKVASQGKSSKITDAKAAVIFAVAMIPVGLLIALVASPTFLSASQAFVAGTWGG